MEYREGQIGRVFVARLDHQDDLLEKIKELAKKEQITTGIFWAIGALQHATLVKGPQKDELPPLPVKESFQGARELLGTGTVMWDEYDKAGACNYNHTTDKGDIEDKSENTGPQIHLHGTTGGRDGLTTGCLREHAEVYITVEVILLEISGLEAFRGMDPHAGLKLLSFRR